MKINPFNEKYNDNDSKKTTNPNYKVISHQGLIPVTLKMLNKCIKQKKKQIDGIDFNKVINISRIDNMQPKTNKVIFTINDNTDVLNIVKAFNQQTDQLQLNCYYQMVLSVKQDKQQFVILCDKISKVSNFGQLHLHLLRVIAASVQRKNNRNRN